MVPYKTLTARRRTEYFWRGKNKKSLNQKNMVIHKISFCPGNSDLPVLMEITVPQDCDPEEYIDGYLDGMLNDFLRYNSDWDFV